MMIDTSDRALDAAAGFQQGFSTYLPLYNEYTGAALSLARDIQRPYDELREIDFARLTDAARRCQLVASGLAERLDTAGARVGEVSGWTGAAAEAFRGHAQRVLAAARVIGDDLGSIASATGGAVADGRQVVSEYVAAIREIDFTGFDPPDRLRFMIVIERGACPAGEVLKALMDWLGDVLGVVLPLAVRLRGGGGPAAAVTGLLADMAGGIADHVLDALGMSADAFLHWVAARVRDYLDTSLRARFETNLELLHQAVEAATAGIRAALQPVVDAAQRLPDDPLAPLPTPEPGEPGSLNGSGSPGGCGPVSAGPGGGTA